jgi:hypothetical protein
MLAEVFMLKTQALGRASKDWSTTHSSSVKTRPPINHAPMIRRAKRARVKWRPVLYAWANRVR